MHLLGKWHSNPRAALPDEPDVSIRYGGLRLFLGCQITQVANETSQLIFEGTIFDRTPEELLTSQHALDTAFGLYTYVKINKGTGVITLGTDRQGYSPLYFAQEGEEFFFSSSLTLLKYRLRRVDPDYDAWDEILNLEDILGSKTSIKQIKRLPPGTRLCLADGKITCETWWQPEVPPTAPQEKYVERNNELLMEALEYTRHAPGEKIMLMSGGQDSRRLGVTAHHIQLPITIASQETVNWAGVDEDVVLAQRVAEYLGVPFHRTKLLSAEGFYNDYLLRDFWLGFESNQHEWILPLIRELPENSLVFDGITGDVTITNGWFREVFPELTDKWRDKDVDMAAERICRNKNVFRIDKRKLNANLFERVRASILSYPECPHRLNYHWMMNRARRNTALQAQLYSLLGHRVCFPYLYYPLFLQCMSLDPETLLEKPYQLECMRRLNPGAADMPSTRGEMGPEDFIDRSQEQEERKVLFSKKAIISSDVRRLFNGLGGRLLIYEIVRLLGIRPIMRRGRWLARPLARMSAFLEFLEDQRSPCFPVEEQQPAFLQERFIKGD